MALTDPSMTPSGASSVEFDGHFLQCCRDGDRLELRNLISGKDEYSVKYERGRPRWCWTTGYQLRVDMVSVITTLNPQSKVRRR